MGFAFGVLVLRPPPPILVWRPVFFFGGGSKCMFEVTHTKSVILNAFFPPKIR